MIRSVERGVVLICVVLLSAAETVQAGINVWTSHGPPGGDVLALVVDPGTPSTLYAATGGGVYKSTDKGNSWTLTHAYPSGTALAIDPITPSTLYAGTYDGDGHGVFKSTDGGDTWSYAGLSDYTSITVLAVDPVNPSTLYAARSANVYKSTDGASSWEPVNTGLPTTSEFGVAALVIDPVMPSRLYAGIAYGGEASGIYRSRDGGGTWSATDTGLSQAPYVFALAIDPTAPDTVYAATAFYGVLQSTDGGDTWGGGNYLQFMETTLFALAVDPTTPSTLYAAGDRVFRSTDGGSTWRPFDAGLTNLEVRALAIDPTTPGTVYAGTQGGGVFSIQQATCAGDCNGDGSVKVGELVTGMNIASEILPLSACPAFDAGADGDVTIDEVMAAVSDGLYGYPTDLTDLSGTLFVTDSDGDKVYALDAATGEILTSAHTDVHPVGVERANGKVYVANDVGTISIYDSATLAPRTVIPACGRPHHTAVSPDGTRFYVACLATNKVAVVDTSTDTLVGLLTSGEPTAKTHQPWPTTDGKGLWVANWETDDITEIDLEAGEIRRTIRLRTSPFEARPIEVVVPADAKTAYVSVPFESTIKVFDLETDELVAEPEMPAPENLMLSGDGKTILASWSGAHDPTAALIFDTETLTTVAVDLPGVFASHTDFTPRGKFGFVSLVALPQSGVAVVDIEKAKLHDFYPIPGIALIHAVRYAPGPP